MGVLTKLSTDNLRDKNASFPKIQLGSRQEHARNDTTRTQTHERYTDAPPRTDLEPDPVPQAHAL